MSQFLAEILNESVPNNFSYLELGCYIKTNFNKVNMYNKECVDIHSKFNPTYVMPTDQFFEQNKKTYDIVFIDANHDLEYVVRDFNNSLKIANKIIVMHDMYPPNEEQTASGYCSDSYKYLLHMEEYGIEHYTFNDDFGLTFVFPPFKAVEFNKIKQYTYSELVCANVKRYNRQEIISIIKGKI